MTQTEWAACRDPDQMLTALREFGRPGDRELRLFGVACCRRLWHLMHPLSREAVEVAERFADGAATAPELRVAEFDAHEAPCAHGDGPPPAACAVASEGATFASEVASRYASGAVADVAGAEASAREDAAQAAFLRDIFAHPFSPLPVLGPSLLTHDMLSLARSAYEARQMPEGTLALARLAALADALEAAGCTDADLLAHLRSPGPHVRGCHRLDVLLGKR
jgi:hypothetical protein